MMSTTSNLSLKLADTAEDLHAAQRLRYRVFVEELGAETDAVSAELGLERDIYDEYFDHLILQDSTLPKGDDVVGVYRMLRGDIAKKNVGFYSQSEFDLSKVNNCGRKTLELGRSCVDQRYRGGFAMHLLWNGLADYVLAHEIEILFGVASFHSTDTDSIAHALSYLHYNHLACEDLRVVAQGEHAVKTDALEISEVERSIALMQIPPLLKSYLRLGGAIGSGAYIDYRFNTTDVCLVMDTARMAQKYKAFYERDSAA